MTSKDPRKRPTAEKVLNNPIFWNSNKIKLFIEACFDLIKENQRGGNDKENFDQFTREKIFLDDWLEMVDLEVKARLKKFGKYDGRNNIDLLRAVRNAVRK